MTRTSRLRGWSEIIGEELAIKVRDAALTLYKKARDYAKERDIIIADSKMEFAVDEDGNLYLVDEYFTPDSSRFWRFDAWRLADAEGHSPDSLDKEPVRKWARSVDIVNHPETPVPPEVLEATTERYLEILELLAA